MDFETRRQWQERLLEIIKDTEEVTLLRYDKSFDLDMSKSHFTAYCAGLNSQGSRIEVKIDLSDYDAYYLMNGEKKEKNDEKT